MRDADIAVTTAARFIFLEAIAVLLRFLPRAESPPLPLVEGAIAD
jgi:hypothetical protein